MISTTLAYVLAFPIIILCYTVAAPVVFVATLPFVLLGRRHRFLAYVCRFGWDFGSVAIAVSGFFAACWIVGAHSSYAMLLVPQLLFLNNALSRVKTAQASTSRVARMLMDEGSPHDPKFEVRLEWTAIAAQVVAFFTIPYLLDKPFW